MRTLGKALFFATLAVRPLVAAEAAAASCPWAPIGTAEQTTAGGSEPILLDQVLAGTSGPSLLDQVITATQERDALRNRAKSETPSLLDTVLRETTRRLHPELPIPAGLTGEALLDRVLDATAAEPFRENPNRFLGLPASATDEAVRDAYRRALVADNPLLHPGDSATAERYRELLELVREKNPRGLASYGFFHGAAAVDVIRDYPEGGRHVRIFFPDGHFDEGVLDSAGTPRGLWEHNGTIASQRDAVAELAQHAYQQAPELALAKPIRELLGWVEAHGDPALQLHLAQVLAGGQDVRETIPLVFGNFDHRSRPEYERRLRAIVDGLRETPYDRYAVTHLLMPDEEPPHEDGQTPDAFETDLRRQAGSGQFLESPYTQFADALEKKYLDHRTADAGPAPQTGPAPTVVFNRWLGEHPNENPPESVLLSVLTLEDPQTALDYLRRLPQKEAAQALAWKWVGDRADRLVRDRAALYLMESRPHYESTGARYAPLFLPLLDSLKDFHHTSSYNPMRQRVLDHLSALGAGTPEATAAALRAAVIDHTLWGSELHAVLDPHDRFSQAAGRRLAEGVDRMMREDPASFLALFHEQSYLNWGIVQGQAIALNDQNGAIEQALLSKIASGASDADLAFTLLTHLQPHRPETFRFLQEVIAGQHPIRGWRKSDEQGGAEYALKEMRARGITEPPPQPEPVVPQPPPPEPAIAAPAPPEPIPPAQAPPVSHARRPWWRRFFRPPVIQ